MCAPLRGPYGATSVMADGAGATESGPPEEVGPIEGSLLSEADVFRSAFEDAPIGMAIVDVSPGRLGRFVLVNEALAELTGYPRDALVGMDYADLTHSEDLEEDDQRMRELIDGTIPRYQLEKRYIHAGGHVVWVLITASLVRSRSGDPLYAIRQAMDINVRKLFEGQLGFLADHDPLTGLFNRRRFARELTRELAYARRYGGHGAVALLDLDRLKEINDTFGHSAGDDALVKTAQLLRHRLRDTDVLARMGGDEFAIALPHTDREQAGALLNDLLRLVSRDIGIVVAPGRPLTVSVGMTMFGDDPKAVGSDLLVLADTAMYQAKAQGGDACVIHDPGGDAADKSRIPRRSWAARIRDALDGELSCCTCSPSSTSPREARPSTRRCCACETAMS